jgi:hypothetical protein
LSSKTTSGGDVSQLYGEMMDEHETMSRFLRSSFVRKMWPASLIDASVPYFRYERLIKQLTAPGYSTNHDDPWNDLREIVTQSPLTTLPLWMLGTNHQELEIARRKDLDGGYAPQAELLLSEGSIAERQFGDATRHLERFLQIAPTYRRSAEIYQLYVFALCLDGQQAKADAVVKSVTTLSWPSPTCGPVSHAR